MPQYSAVISGDSALFAKENRTAVSQLYSFPSAVRRFPLKLRVFKALQYWHADCLFDGRAGGGDISRTEVEGMRVLKLLRIVGFILAGSLAAAGAHATSVLSGSFTADNDVFVYLSTSASQLGTLIGSGNNWQSTFYATPASLSAGTTYYLNVEAINGDSGSYSAGGFIGDFTLSGGATFSNGQTTLLTSTAGWVASYNDNNGSDTAQPWVQPTGSVESEGANGVSPWGTVSGVSASAMWIWAADLRSGDGSAPGNQCASCTVDFQTSFTTAGTAVPEPGSMALLGAGLAGFAFARRKRILGGAA
jgi:hypothetical protein